MGAKEIVEAIDTEANDINGRTNCGRVGKHTGAVSVDIIKEEFESIDWLSESIDIFEESFIQGYNSQFDLLMVKKGAIRVTHRCFKPEDVLVVFEVKYNGIISKVKMDKKIKVLEAFLAVKRRFKRIHCVFLAIHESRSYLPALAEYPDEAFYLSIGQGRNSMPTSNWEDLLSVLEDLFEGRRNEKGN